MSETVSIESIGNGGVGVGRLADGLTVFVPRTAPGDVVEIEITTRKPRWGRGKLLRVVTAGPDRIKPPCDHYVNDGCGGCQLQHLTMPAQRLVKGRIIGDAIRRIGGLDVEDPIVAAAPVDWGYRRRIRFSARAGKEFGYRPHDDPAGGFAVNDCAVAAEGLMDLWQYIRGPIAEISKATGVSLRRDRIGQTHIMLEEETPERASRVADRMELGDAVTVWSMGGPVNADQTGPPPGAFEQSSPELAAGIREEAIEFLAPQPSEIAWDLYAGLGDTTRALSPMVEAVWSVDSDADAMQWAHGMAVEEGDIRFVAARVEDAVTELPDADVIVVNPPRSGLSKPVRARLRALGKDRPGVRMAYISCDPATLARDIKALEHFALESVRGYDLFPQTSHVETLATLRGPG